jgi:AcrR family transcriptional regulator
MTTSTRASTANRPTTAEAILESALQVFYEKGYHGASIRAIARGAGVGLATLFHHYPNKSVILERIVNGAADAMRSDLDRTLDGLTDPTERVAVAVRTMVIASCERQRESFVAQSEFRSLTEADFKKNREKRRAIQRVFSDAVNEGVSAGQFSARHPNDVARSLVLLGSAVALWYKAGQGLTTEEVADVHVEMALDLVVATGR